MKVHMGTHIFCKMDGLRKVIAIIAKSYVVTEYILLLMFERNFD